MYPANTQLLAKWSSPSIGDQRATGWEQKVNEKTLGHLILERFAIFNPTYWSPMLGEDHFATSWVWAGYILDSGYFQFQPFLIGYFGEIAFLVFLHYKINGSKGVFWP